MTLADIITRLKQAENISDFHELDTIERIIVPVLGVAGWDIDSICPNMSLKRDNGNRRGKARRFDLQLFCGGTQKPKIVIECKKLSDTIKWRGLGWDINGRRNHKDYLRQIREDCTSDKFAYHLGYTTPVLTNGRTWLILTDAFIESTSQRGGITEQNRETFISAQSSLSDTSFDTDIIAKLRPPSD